MKVEAKKLACSMAVGTRLVGVIQRRFPNDYFLSTPVARLFIRHATKRGSIVANRFTRPLGSSLDRFSYGNLQLSHLSMNEFRMVVLQTA